MAGTSYTKCPQCRAMNLNRDYCQSCGALINAHLKREIERHTRTKAKEVIPKQPNPITVFFEKATNHPILPVRLVAKFFYSVWAVVLSIGTLLAFLFSYVAA